MEIIHITVFIIVVIAMLIYGFRKKIKAWIIQKVLEYASKKMMENISKNAGGIDLSDLFGEEKRNENKK